LSKKNNGGVIMLNTRRVTEELVRTVPEPPFTQTWHPIAHYKVIDALEIAIAEKKVKVIDRSYSLSEDYANVFGTWRLSSGENGTKWSLGWRNSLKKNFAVGICAGNYVVNCSNLEFYGEFEEFRRHTSGLDFDFLVEMSKKAMTSILKRFEELSAWHSTLKNISFENFEQFKIITFDAMTIGVFSPNKFNAFVKCFKIESGGDRMTKLTLYNFHSAVTRLMREDSFFSINRHSKLLNALLNDFVISVEK